MGTYLGRNVNLALLIIIIGVVVALVGTTVFFQRSLQNRTGDYQGATQTLASCQTALQNYQNQYSQAQLLVNQTSQDIKRYDDLYEAKVAELKETQVQLATTEKQMQFEKLQKEKFQDYYEDAAQTAATLNATIKTLNNRINDLEDDLDACEG